MAVTFNIDADIFRQDVSIDPNDLNKCFTEHAGLFAYYAACHVEAMRRESAAKISMEMMEAKAAKQFRDEAIVEKTKATEAMIDQAVTMNADVVKARLHHSRTKADVQYAYHAVEAFRQRRDMLIQMGAAYREEMKGELRTRVSTGESAVELLRRANA